MGNPWKTRSSLHLYLYLCLAISHLHKSLYIHQYIYNFAFHENYIHYFIELNIDHMYMINMCAYVCVCIYVIFNELNIYYMSMIYLCMLFTELRNRVFQFCEFICWLGPLDPQVESAAMKRLDQTLVNRKYHIVAIFVISDLLAWIIHTKVCMGFNLSLGCYVINTCPL